MGKVGGEGKLVWGRLGSKGSGKSGVEGELRAGGKGWGRSRKRKGRSRRTDMHG